MSISISILPGTAQLQADGREPRDGGGGEAEPGKPLCGVGEQRQLCHQLPAGGGGGGGGEEDLQPGQVWGAGRGPVPQHCGHSTGGVSSQKLANNQIWLLTQCGVAVLDSYIYIIYILYSSMQFYVSVWWWTNFGWSKLVFNLNSVYWLEH